MLIGFSALARPPQPGDFGATVERNELLLPTALKELLQQSQIRTAEDLVASLRVFPSAFAGNLGWGLDDVHAARAELLKMLRGHLAEEFYDEEPSCRPNYGVRLGRR